ncbi:MAG: TIGR02300 family protein [Rhodomicrobium sp.]
MSIKAERGTKRVCQSPSCGGKFYDLNRDPIVCPICHTVYQLSAPSSRAAGGNNLDADDDAVLDAGRTGLEFVPLDEVAAREGEDLPEIEGGDIGDVAGDEEETLDTGGEDEPFLEAEDEGEADMSGFVSGSKDEEA